MRIKLDENLPLQLGTVLKELGHEVSTVRDEGLTGHADKEIWQAAQKESRFLITQDLDFSDLASFAPGSHYGLLLVRLHSPNRRSLVQRTAELFREEEVEEWTGCFVVATERKIRVLKPEKKQRS